MRTAIVMTSLLFASTSWAQEEVTAAPAEPTTAEPADAEPADAEPADAKPEPADAEPAEPADAEPAEPADAEPAEPAEPAVETTAVASDTLGIEVGAKVGATIPTSDLGATYFLGIEAAYQLPFLDRMVGVGFELSFGAPTSEGRIQSAAVGGPFPYRIDMRLITLAFEVSGRRSFGDLTPYGALGYGLYFLHANVRSYEDSTEDQVRAGFQLRGGCGYRLGPGDVFAELRYHYVNLRFLSTGKSNGGGISLNAGYRYTF